MTMHDDRDEPVRTEELVAYAEGRLPAGSRLRARVEAHLHRHPADAARVQAYRDQDALIREAFGDVAGESVPARLLPGSAADGRRRFRAAPAMAAALVVGIAVGWLGAQFAAMDPRRPALQGFAERVADRLSGPANKGEAVAPVASGGVPDLGAAGLRPVGRGEAGDTGTRRFDYRDANGNTVHLFVSRDIASTTPSIRTLETGGHTLAYWHKGEVTYVLGAQGPRDRIVATAREVRDMLGTASGSIVATPPAPSEPTDEVIAVTPESGDNGDKDSAEIDQGSTGVAVPEQM